MSFEEILERYKNGLATDDEKIMIENEIGKYRALTDYYLDIDESPQDISKNINPEMDRMHQTEINHMKKAVKTKKLLIVLTTTIVSCILVFAFHTIYQKVAIPYMNNHVYYDPDISGLSEYTTDLSVVLGAFSELHLPDNLTNLVSTDNTGIGTYDLTIQNYNLFTGKLEYHYGTINKSVFTIDQSFFEYPAANGFVNSYSMANPHIYLAETIETLQKLPNNTLVQAYASFSNDLSMEQLSTILEENSNMFFYWAVVRGCQDGAPYSQIGFNPSGNGYIYEKVNDAYPYYELSLYDDASSAEALNQHFLSLLEFAMDHSQLINKIVNDDYFDDYYSDVMEYVRENGVRTYGIALMGSPEDILKLSDNENICDISIADIKWAAYY